TVEVNYVEIWLNHRNCAPAAPDRLFGAKRWSRPIDDESRRKRHSVLAGPAGIPELRSDLRRDVRLYDRRLSDRLLWQPSSDRHQPQRGGQLRGCRQHLRIAISSL